MPVIRLRVEELVMIMADVGDSDGPKAAGADVPDCAVGTHLQLVFRLRGPDLLPDKITDETGVQPSGAYKRGERCGKGSQRAMWEWRSGWCNEQDTVEHLQEDGQKKDRTISAQAERIKELEAALEGARRAGKRQASPFSKGAPKENPGRPGRKAGEGHGRHGHRMAPPGPPDRELAAPLPSCCPDCGGEVDHESEAEQWQVDLGEPKPVKTRFRVTVGRCKKCGRRVQGRHPDQVSDALGAAGSQVGPNAKAWASFLHYSLGLSWGKVQKLLARLGVAVTAGALCQASERQACTDLVPVHHELVRVANSAAVLVMDETGWRVGGERAWLWEATNAELTVYWVARGRGFEQACQVRKSQAPDLPWAPDTPGQAPGRRSPPRGQAARVAGQGAAKRRPGRPGPGTRRACRGRH
jgi:transposase